MTSGWVIYGRFAALAIAVTALLAALGLLPTRRLAGDEAVGALLAGCAIGLAASLAGAVPVLLARGVETGQATPIAMMAMSVRLVLVIALGLIAAGSGLWAPKPLLVWVVISHAGLLIPDSLLSIKVLAQREPAED